METMKWIPYHHIKNITRELQNTSNLPEILNIGNYFSAVTLSHRGSFIIIILLIIIIV